MTEHDSHLDKPLTALGEGQAGIFDLLRPPDPELVADCVHCGFCLPKCPTYSLWGHEADSPRGRIHLLKAGLDGELPMDDGFAGHFDSCLGCMSCVTACPSGVQYDKLLRAARPQLERNRPRSFGDRVFRNAIFAVFPYPRRLRVAAVLGIAYQVTLQPLLRKTGLLNRLPARLRALEGLMPPMRLGSVLGRLPEYAPAAGPVRCRVGLLAGCAQQVFFSEVNRATIRVLTAEGCEVFVPTGDQCCGALSEHAGREPEALRRARAMVDLLGGLDLDHIVVNVAGCGSTMKEYGELLHDDPEYADKAEALAAKVLDVSELLSRLRPIAPRNPIQARVAYHDACHLAHAQRVRDEPRAVLRTVPGLEVLEIPEWETCCGSAGIYNLVNPEAAEELGRKKVANIVGVAPDIIATANPGCLLQLQRFLERDIPLVHPVQLLDWSIRGLHGVPGPGQLEPPPA